MILGLVATAAFAAGVPAAVSRSAEGAPAAVSKTAFLTFDDGPSVRVTPRILRVLADYGVKGTFFLVGTAVRKHPQLARQIVAEGHAIGNHSFDHRTDVIYASPEAFLDSLRRGGDEIEKATGIRPVLMRPPGWPTRRFRAAIRRAACQQGYVLAGYNAGVYDTHARSMDPKMMLDYVVQHTHNGRRRRVVVLMHDTTDKETTAEVLPDVIEYLRLHQYRLEVMSPDEIASAPSLE